MENAEVQKIVSEAKELFEKEGESFEEEHVAKLEEGLPDKPIFPINILLVAALKDAIDIFDLTIIGIIPTTILTVVIWLILFWWMWSKINWWQKGLTRWALRRLVIFMLGEVTPFLKIIPFSSIFVVMAHNREKKIVQLFYQVADKIRTGGIGPLPAVK